MPTFALSTPAQHPVITLVDNGGNPVTFSKIVRKTVDQTFASTTGAKIADLSFDITASEIWAFEVALIYDTTISNDVRIGVTVPAGATLLWSGTGLASSVAAGGTGSMEGRAMNASGSEFTYGGGRAAGTAAQRLGITLRGIVVNGTTVGAVELTGRKSVNTDATSPADDTTIYANSFLWAQKFPA